MILPNMSFQEIDKTLRREFLSAKTRIDIAANKFGSIVKKTRLYPCHRVFTIKTKDRAELHLIFIAFKRSDWNHPKLCIFTTFHLKNELYTISIDSPKGVAQIYTPHFFERYRERIAENADMGIMDLTKRFLIINKDMVWHPNTEAFSAAYQKYEKENVTQMAARVEEGNCFIEQIDDKLLLLKTILSDEMLGEGQSKAFTMLEDKRKEFHATTKPRKVSYD